MKRSLERIALGFVYLVAVVFSLKQLIEPDLWWQLRTGEWILETGSIPRADPFSFTYDQTPWQNIKWGFEVIIAILAKTLGVEMLMMVQVACSIGIAFLLIRLAHQLAPASKKAIIYTFVGLSFILLEYRMTGRPESITYVFFLLLCSLLLSFRNVPSRIIWWIPALLLCWANLHEAFGIGLVVLVLFTVSAWIEAFVMHTQTKWQATQLLVVLGVSLVSICINPNHFHILLKPFDIANQVYENKFTSEFTTYAQPSFWTKEAWVTLSLFIGVCLAFVIRFLSGKEPDKWQKLNRIIPIPLAVLLFAFVYLASTGHRNIIFATLLLTPLSVMQFTWLTERFKLKVNEQAVNGIFIVLALSLYVSVVSNSYYQFWKSKNRYGLEIPAYATPIGAASFIAEKDLMKKPVLSDYLTSSYLLWRLQPQFKTFIDLRDLDVFPVEHFSLFARMLVNPAVFEKVDSQYQFGSVVLLRSPQMRTLHAYLYHHPVYRLAYLDAICCVYIKDSTFASPERFNHVQFVPAAPASFAISKTFNPWYRAGDISGLDEIFAAAEYYTQVEDRDKATFYARLSAANGNESYKGLELLGQLSYQHYAMDTSSGRALWLDSASSYFQQSLKSNPDFVPALIDMGVFAFNQKQYKSALNYLEKACAIDPTSIAAHKNAAEVYKTLAETGNNKKNLEKAIEHFHQVDHINPNNPEILMNLGFLYFRIGDCDHAVRYLEQIVDYDQITELQRSRARECIQKCN